MDGFEDKLAAILNDPKAMQQIMSIAQSFGQSQPDPKENRENSPEPPAFDQSILQKIGNISGSSTIDQEQISLLQALRPYLTGERIQKLEKAMRAAKMARMASAFLNSGGLQLLSGR